MRLHKVLALFTLYPLLLASAVVWVSDGGNGWGTGETVAAGDMNAIKTAADDTDGRVTALEALDFLVGTATGALSAEIVVGATPGGELGGTWASPTIDDGISVNFADGSIEAADLAAGVTRDTELSLHTESKQIGAPQDGESWVVLGLPFAATLVGYRCNVIPDDFAQTVPITLQECTSASCTTVDTGMTCDDDLDAVFDTTISDAAIASGAQLRVLIGTPSASMATAAVALDVVYSRQVVQ